MASLIEELFSILEEETGCYKSLLDMADNKKEVIIKGDVPSLQEITKKEQELAGHILRLEKARQQNLIDICDVTNKKIEDVTIVKIIDLLQGKEKDKLRTISNGLNEILIKLQEMNVTNKALIEQSIDYINFTVNAAQSLRSMPDTNTYQAKGNRYENTKGKNFFDAKQ